jgi:GNAT superfamily N-acetyltransferase
MIDSARPEDAAALAALFSAARRTAMPWLPELHTAAEDREFVERRVLAECEVLVARRDGEPLAFLALNGGQVDHLYVRPDAQRQGVGGALLDAAKARRPRGLQLWAFQRNGAALAFYARHGFTELDRTDGRDNEEREPDVRLGWRP